MKMVPPLVLLHYLLTMMMLIKSKMVAKFSSRGLKNMTNLVHKLSKSDAKMSSVVQNLGFRPAC